MELFLSILACAFGVLSFLLIIVRLLGKYFYNRDPYEQIRDAMHGQTSTYPIAIPGIIFITCAAWIISYLI